MTATAQMARLLDATGVRFSAPTLSRYLSDPEYRAKLDAERVVKQAKIGAAFEAHDRARQEAAWARDGEIL